MKTPAPILHLGAHHFAYLRALAEGVGVAEAAQRYLPVDRGREATLFHAALIDRVRALARRRGDSRWRLVGIELQDVQAPQANRPDLHSWADAQGWGDWSHDELIALYEERFGLVDQVQRRRTQRNARLREKRLALLRELEGSSVDQAQPTDLVEGWLSPEVAEQLRRCGTLTLGDLRQRIEVGGCWWAVLKSVGPVKARRLAQHVDLLLGPASKATWAMTETSVGHQVLDGRAGTNRAHLSVAGVDAQNDRDAMRAWISARVGSVHTAKQYEREAERFMLWCLKERGKALSDANAQDCRAYMDFLGAVPADWISRVKAGRFEAGWAPFKGQLSLASQGLAIAALHSLFSWLVAARYLASNPWVLVNRKLGDDPGRNEEGPTSRAFTPAAWAALHAALDQVEPGPSAARLRWLCLFVEGTGLRANELLSARCSDLRETAEGWLLRVHGKGRRNRTIPVPGSALEATRVYFALRGFALTTAPADAPLMASLLDPLKSVSYSALHETFTRFVRRSLGALTPEERITAQRASAHWLRHTHATRAAERLVPADVLQENLGQSDPRTTARYYRAQLKRRQAELQRAFG